MTLRIFQVSSDGVAVAVPKDGDREIAPPTPSPPAPTGPERWTGSSEWDKLRSRLREAEPRVDARTRRRR